MNYLDSLVIIAVAGLIHASFQLSVSMLTLLSSHTIGRRRSQARLLALMNSFTLGAAVMTVLLLSFAALVVSLSLDTRQNTLLAWTVTCGLLGGVGLAVWLFYYRREVGTTLWIPRGMARFLNRRAKSTKDPTEAFGLGLISVLAELLFVLAPILVAALVLVELPTTWQLVGIALYTVVSLLSLFVVNAWIGSGHSISRVQRWRESNKRFLQFAAGSGLLILGFYLYVDHVVTVTALAAAGGAL